MSLLGIKPVDIHHEVCDIYGNGQMSRESVCRHLSALTAPQGRPATVTANNTVVKIHQLLQRDAKYTVRQT